MLFRGNFRRLCYRAFAFEYGGTLSPIGQVIIMILIELGGLGFLTVATIFFSLLRKKRH